MKTQGIWRNMVAFFLALAVASALGCSAGQVAQPLADSQVSEGMIVMIDGLSPPWDLGDMVKQSDAIVMGSLETKLGTKTEPGGSNDPSRFSYEFTDYEFKVDKTFYPKDGLPGTIAVLAETGAVPVGEIGHVETNDEVPAYAEDEEIVLFLVSLEDDQEHSQGVGRPVPEPFSAADYFRAVIGRDYGKMENNGKEWEDSRSGKTFTVSELERAVEEHKED